MAKPRTNPGSSEIQKLLYRRKEAAFALGVSVREIDRLISERELTPRRYKRCVLISADDVLRVRDTILSSDKYAA